MVDFYVNKMLVFWWNDDETSTTVKDRPYS